MAGRFVRETLGIADFEPTWATWLHMHDSEYNDPYTEGMVHASVWNAKAV